MSVRLFSVGGTPVYLQWLTVLLLVVIGLTAGPTQAGLMAGVFALVILHELGHCRAATLYGLTTDHIVITPLGGLAMIEHDRLPPIQEIVIVAAGPAVNVVLAAPLWAAWRLTGYSDLFVANLCLLVFNLLPVFPLDGGRLLRASLTPLVGFQTATIASCLVGMVGGSALMALGVVFINPFAVMTGILIILAALQEMSLA
jgi:Zn-dependent protease